MDNLGMLQLLTEKYQRDGYEVLRRPDPTQIPAFLEGAPVDLLARRGDHLVAIKAKDNAGNDDEVVRVEADLGVASIASLLQEAESLLNPRTMRAALAMAWAAFEASARAVLQLGATASVKALPRQLLEEIHSRGWVGDEEFWRLQQCFYRRNAVVHGISLDEMPPDLVSFLLGITHRLLGKLNSRGREIALPILPLLFRKRVTQSPSMKRAAERASKILQEFLGPSLHSVTIEWDLAEDARRKEVLVLKLSDSTGEVTATFEPWELEDEAQLRARLNHLWGDLLQIRSHAEVQRLLGATEK